MCVVSVQATLRCVLAVNCTVPVPVTALMPIAESAGLPLCKKHKRPSFNNVDFIPFVSLFVYSFLSSSFHNAVTLSQLTSRLLAMDQTKRWVFLKSAANSSVGTSIQDLPDEIIALILCKLNNPWYHASRLSHLCRKFCRVKDNWMHGLLAEVFLPNVHHHELSVLLNLVKGSQSDVCLPVRSMKLGISARRRFLTKPPPPINMMGFLSRFPSLIYLNLLGMQDYIKKETVQTIVTELTRLKELSLSLYYSVRYDGDVGIAIENKLITGLDYFHQQVIADSDSKRMACMTTKSSGKDVSWLVDNAGSDAIHCTRSPFRRDNNHVHMYTHPVMTLPRPSIVTYLLVAQPFALESSNLLRLLAKLRCLTVLSVAIVGCDGTRVIPLDREFLNEFAVVCPKSLMFLNMIQWYTREDDTVLLDTARRCASLGGLEVLYLPLEERRRSTSRLATGRFQRRVMYSLK